MNNLVGIWYPTPTEVKFRLTQTKFHVGIAYQDHIIDLKDGVAYRVDDILYAAVVAGDDPDEAIVEWCEWLPIKKILE